MKRPLALSVAVFVSVATANASADPSKVECVAANDQARDLRRVGNLKAAREQLAVCVAQSCPGPVREDCAQRLAEIATAQPSIVFAAKDGAGNDLSAVTVTVDGQPLAEKLDGSALDVDPGEHTFRFEGTGGVTEKHLVVREGEKGRRETVVLGGAGSSQDRTNGASTQNAQTGSSRWPVYVAFGVGGAGLLVGSITGVMALSTKSTLNSPGVCHANKTGCPPGDVTALSTEGWASNVGFAVGIVGAGVGIVLLVTSGSHGDQRVGVRFGPGSVGLVGTLP
jgi:hypothetical protein